MPETTNAPTTATLRRLAREAEGRLDWTLAADLYDRAADAYPKLAGQFAAADVAKLRQNAAICRAFNA